MGLFGADADIGIDLGTASVLVYINGKGVVLKEPSVVAYDTTTNEIKAIGEEARQMIGRTPGNIKAVRPLRAGVISDYTITEKMIRYFIRKALGKRTFRRPRISVCVPSHITEVERKAVEDATINAGAREVFIIEEPVAAAIGAGIDIAKPCGNMIVDIGGGTTDIAVISLGGTVVSDSLKVAGDDFDDAIVRYMRRKHNLLIGEMTAEEIKIKIGTCYKRDEELTLDVCGRNLVTGLPKTVTVASDETLEALQESERHRGARHRADGRRRPFKRHGPPHRGAHLHHDDDRRRPDELRRDRHGQIHRLHQQIRPDGRRRLTGTPGRQEGGCVSHSPSSCFKGQGKQFPDAAHSEKRGAHWRPFAATWKESPTGTRRTATPFSL